MNAPFPGTWDARPLTSEDVVLQFTNLVGGLAGLTIHERDDGEVFAFIESGGLVRHLVTWGRDGWVCSCVPFHETLGDCVATILIRLVNVNNEAA